LPLSTLLVRFEIQNYLVSLQARENIDNQHLSDLTGSMHLNRHKTINYGKDRK